MKGFSLLALLLFLIAAPSFAQGPFLTPPPPNPCLGPPLVTRWIANEVGTDAGGAPCGIGGGCVETLVTCTHRGAATDPPIDVVVELYTSGGVLAATGFLCGIAPGAAAPFVTGGAPLAPGYTYAAPIAPGAPVTPLGSLRVLTAGPNRAVCDVSLIDTSGPVTGMTGGGPSWTKPVKLTYRNKPQRGD